MRVRSMAVLLVLGLSACHDQGAVIEPETFVVPVYDHAGRDHQEFFRADTLHGKNEVPVRVTTAYGQATFQLVGDSITYRLVVHAVDNVLQAHIHVGATGVNGGIVAWLYPSAPPATLIPGRFKGVLGQGAIGDGEVVGTLAGQGVAGLLAALRSGDTYVNVHTQEFTGGEIRGQIP